MIMADILASSHMDSETGAKHLSKFVQYHIILKKGYNIKDEKAIHISFKNYVGTYFIKMKNYEKNKLLSFDFENRSPKHLSKVK
jgi:hypothetical protein